MEINARCFISTLQNESLWRWPVKVKWKRRCEAVHFTFCARISVFFFFFLIDPILDNWWEANRLYFTSCWVFCISISGFFNHSIWKEIIGRQKQNYRISLPTRAILVNLLEHGNLCSTLYTWLDSILGVKFSVLIEAKCQRCTDTCSVIIWLSLTWRLLHPFLVWLAHLQMHANLLYAKMLKPVKFAIAL